MKKTIVRRWIETSPYGGYWAHTKWPEINVRIERGFILNATFRSESRLMSWSSSEYFKNA